RRLILGGVDTQQDVAARHLLAFHDAEFRDTPHDVRLDIDLPVRLDPAARGDGRDEVAPLHRLDAYLRPVAAAGGGKHGNRDDGEDGASADDELRSPAHQRSPGFTRNGRPTAASSAVRFSWKV